MFKVTKPHRSQIRVKELSYYFAQHNLYRLRGRFRHSMVGVQIAVTSLRQQLEQSVSQK